jgi:hypothetical protein
LYWTIILSCWTISFYKLHFIHDRVGVLRFCGNDSSPKFFNTKLNNIALIIAGQNIKSTGTKYGRWVEGGSTGKHQKWSYDFNLEWKKFFDSYEGKKKKPSPKKILEKMEELRKDSRFQ